MKVRILEQPAQVYADADIGSERIAQLPIGAEVEMGAIKKKNGMTFVAVTGPNNQRGYIPGEAKIFHIKLATLLQKTVTVHATASAESPAVMELQKNDQFHMEDVVQRDNKSWVKIRDLKGNEGFIDGETRIQENPEAAVTTKATGGQNMAVGALWCIGGIAVTAFTYSAASSGSGGGQYVVAWGAILFGGLQFLKGLFQSLAAPD